ncbi:DNA-3-methyladenine glycosylase 2 family protein [Glaciecola siphonariae]|uniref:DNA-3-methyladenine glycosylase 2 family protein n=1 Tax=Glaciecola siphonariae TaxID=521012 RepID=A0ABV9LSE7_9ALTE
MLTIEQCERARMARDPRFDGKFFVLVKSTGIFCRPICKVRAPLEKNVEYAHSAVEAMHRGFRPCLRCRPDSSPHSFAWQGVQTTVERAMRLLTEDYSRSIEDVSERLGVSARYLRKLMTSHLQLSPKQFRLFNQILLAKRLLHGSNMNIEQVAQGAGFSSSRQLQHHMKQICSLTPTQIRSAHHAASAKQANIQLMLYYQGEYDWPSMRDFFKRRQIDNNEAVSQTSFTKSLNIHNRNVRVCMRHKASARAFEVSYSHEHVDLSAAIIERVNKILDLQANPYVIYDAIEKAGLKPSQINRGIRIPGLSCRFEAGVRAILGQQVSVQAAITQLNRLQQGLVGAAQSFITPEQLRDADLSFLKMPGARKAALQNFAALMAQHPNADFDQWLALKGIGPWTVNYVKLRATSSTDVWLDTDLIIRQQIKKLHDSFEQQKAPPFTPEHAAPWRSYLTLALWNLA